MSTNKRIDPSIIAAIIGVMGTLCVTLITLYVNYFGLPAPLQPTPTVAIVEPTWTVSPTAALADTPLPTDTVEAGEPTSTPPPDTPVPEPTFTPAPPSIGSDWSNGCISILWIPYPQTVETTPNNGCLQQPVDRFYANAGRLTFLAEGRFENTEVRGLFAPLPPSGTVSISAYLTRVQQGEVWMGIFAQPTIESDGTVIVIPPGDVKKKLLIQKDMPGQVEVQQTATFSQDPPVYDVVFEFGNGAVTTRIMRDTVFNAVPVGSGQQWLFVGYQVKRGNNNINAEFRNLLIQ